VGNDRVFERARVHQPGLPGVHGLGAGVADGYRWPQPETWNGGRVGGDDRIGVDLRANHPRTTTESGGPKQRAGYSRRRHSNSFIRPVFEYAAPAGLNRLRLDEYPVDGLREALVNAVAHRQYEDAGRKIILEIFADRVTLLSPGLPPRPITLANLRKGKYRPCSRNPVLAQCLSYFHRIEERGSGFRRMHDQMLDHGLDPPLLGTDMGYFQVTFPGPGDNIERLRIPEKQLVVTPSVEVQLNERQKDMVSRLVGGEELTSRRCQELYKLSPQAVYEDFQKLVELGVARKIGSGRATRYGYSQHD